MTALIAQLACSLYAAVPALPPECIVFERYQITHAQTIKQLAIVKPDGTGENQLLVKLPELGFPTWSKDGELLALSSVSPDTPFSISRNVFVLHVRTDQISQVTRFADRVSSGSGAGGSATISACTFPWYKAFSPEKSRVAVSAIQFTGVTWSAPNTNDPPPNPSDLYSGFKGTPVLQVYGIDGTPGALVTLGSSGSDSIHAGDGVDWAPDQDLLVYPKDIQVRVVDNIGQVLMMPVTALMLMLPVDDAIGRGKATQLTDPEATATATWTGPIATWETDFQPTFSPDGKRVAYIRAKHTLSGASYYSRVLALRVIMIEGRRDQQLLAIEQSKYVSHLSWSPDGTRLAFDMGNEAYGTAGVPLAMADPSTSSLWVVNADGSGLTAIRPPPVAWPAWYPGWAIEPGVAPQLIVSLIPRTGAPTVVLSWPASATECLLQSSPCVGPLARWSQEPAQPSIAGGQASIALTFDPTPSARFYRLVQP